MPLNKNIKGIRNKYEYTDELKKQKEDAIEIIKMVIKNDSIGIKMKEKVIDTMLWNISGIGEGSDGKYLIRFRSDEAIYNDDASLIHDHVFQRKLLKKSILDEKELTQSTIDKIIGCVVTKKQHDILHKEGKGLDGWDRYIAADITKIQDMQEEHNFILPKRNA